MPITQARLPSWAILNEEKVEIHVDVDLAYPKYLQMLALEASAFNVGAVRNCITRDLRALEGDDAPFPVVRFKVCVLNPQATDEERAAARARWMAANLPHAGNPALEDEQGFKAAGKFRAKLQAARAATALSQE